MTDNSKLHIRKRFFTWSVAGHWNRFPRQMVTAPSLLEEGSWMTLLILRFSFRQSCEKQGVRLDDPSGPLHTSIFRHSMIL